jgi:hypothetical protein
MAVVEPLGQAGPEADDARLRRVALDRLPAMISYWDRDLHNVIAN